MARHRQYLCLFYGLVATIAFIATWIEILDHFRSADSLAGAAGAAVRFLADMRVNPAARTVTLDLLLLSLAVMTFMVLEARRLGIRFVWAYLALGFVLALSVTFPLFMIARERHLAWQEGGETAPLVLIDGMSLAVLSATVVALSGCVIGG
ncbi:MAG: DUF2834 domain-containing protein [Caulobacter sp.]|nr:DUF2834 domain-containing protein [Caulobacter sp.]